MDFSIMSVTRAWNDLCSLDGLKSALNPVVWELLP